VAHTSKRPAPARSGRINLRASAKEKKLIRLGAEKRGEADQQHFELPANKFAEFVNALNRPARVIPALKELFFEPSILEP
jgi:uncharacterized protein (DUF1778 family)